MISDKLKASLLELNYIIDSVARELEDEIHSPATSTPQSEKEKEYWKGYRDGERVKQAEMENSKDWWFQEGIRKGMEWERTGMLTKPFKAEVRK